MGSAMRIDAMKHKFFTSSRLCAPLKSSHIARLKDLSLLLFHASIASSLFRAKAFFIAHLSCNYTSCLLKHPHYSCTTSQDLSRSSIFLSSLSIAPNTTPSTASNSAKPSFLAITLASLVVIKLSAQDISIKNFFYRDYLDFGQNNGIFSPSSNSSTSSSAQGLGSSIILQSLKHKDVATSFPIPIINQSSRSNQGNATSLGRNFAITAHHVTSITEASNPSFTTWGQTPYKKPSDESSKYGRDVKFMRFERYIVEGRTELISTPITGTTQSNSANNDKNIRALELALEQYKDNNGDVLVYQAGQGTLFLREGAGGNLINGGIKGLDGMRGGGLWSISKGSSGLAINYADMFNSKDYGLSINLTPNNLFRNIITEGDSGSGLFIYDKKQEKWVLLGVASEQVGRVNARISFVAQSDFDDYKKDYEQHINLQGHTWSFDAQGLTDTSNNTWKGLQNNKDMVFSGGGGITLGRDMNRNISGQIGGLVFRAESSANASNPTTYTIESSKGGKDFGFNGAGLDIEEFVNVKWNIGFIDNYKSRDNALHKIGKGVLTIGERSNNTAQNTYGYLRVGEGKVVFDSGQKAFEGVYVVGGAHIELAKGKAQGFGAILNKPSLDATLNNHFMLEQANSNAMGIYFGNGGGSMDLQGNSLTLNTIVSNDSLAHVINSDTNNMSVLELLGLGYENGAKSHTKANTMIHASIGASTANNINLIYKGEGNDARLIFDGHINTKGLEVSHGNITLQGHPTTHAYIRDSKILAQVKRAEGSDLPSWMDLSRPSTLEQPDWDKREFAINEVSLEGANLAIGHHADVKINHLTLDKDSSITIGGDMKHFIDKKDGENVSGGGFSYIQHIESQKLDLQELDMAKPFASQQHSPSIFQGKAYINGLEVNGGKVSSQAFSFASDAITLNEGAQLQASFLTLKKSASTSSASTPLTLTGQNTQARIGYMLFAGVKNSASTFINDASNGLGITKGIGFINSSFALENLHTLGLTSSMLASPSQSIKSRTNAFMGYDIFAMDSTLTGSNSMLEGNINLINSSLDVKDIKLNPKARHIIIERTDNAHQASTLKAHSITAEQDSLLIHAIDSTLKTTQGISLNGKSQQDWRNICDVGHTFTQGAACLPALSANEKSMITLQGASTLDSSIYAKNLNLAINISKETSISTINNSTAPQAHTISADASRIGIQIEQGGDKKAFNIDAKNNSHVLLASNATDNAPSTAATMYVGNIIGDSGAKIDATLPMIEANITLQNGAMASINALSLSNFYNTISLSGKASKLAINNVFIANMGASYPSPFVWNPIINDDARLEIEHVIFSGGEVESNKYYGKHLHINDDASVILRATNAQGGVIDSHIAINKGRFTAIGEEVTLVNGRNLILDNGQFIIHKPNNTYEYGTLHIKGNGTDSQSILQNKSGSFNIDTLLASNGANVRVMNDYAGGYNAQALQNSRMIFDEPIYIGGGSFRNFMTDSTSHMMFSQLHISGLYQTAYMDANTHITQKLSIFTPFNNSPSKEQFLTLILDKSPSSLPAPSEPKTLTLDTNATIEIELNGNIKPHIPYTIISAKHIEDRRKDKKITANLGKGFTINGGDNIYYAPYYPVSNIKNGILELTFIEQDPTSVESLLEELEQFTATNNITTSIGSLASILQPLKESGLGQNIIDNAGFASDIKPLQELLQHINSDFQSITTQNPSTINRTMLLLANQSINTRLLQIKFMRNAMIEDALKKTYLASTTNSDAMNLRNLTKSALNSGAQGVWMGVNGGGVFDTSRLLFAHTNIGYDKSFMLNDAEILAGIMAGFGNTSAQSASSSQLARLYTIGLYAYYQHSKHELQSNVSFGYINGATSLSTLAFGAESLSANALSALWSNYYKFRLARYARHALNMELKPIMLLSIGANMMSAMKGSYYTQNAFYEANIGAGVGAEYAIYAGKSSYAFTFLTRKNLLSSQDKIFVSLVNAQSAVGYEFGGDRVGFVANVAGSLYLTPSLTLRYGVGGVAELGGGIGGMGDVRMEYVF